MDLTSQKLDSFLLDGFYKGHIDFIEQIDFDQYEFIDCNGIYGDDIPRLDERLTPIIEQTKQFLLDNYVSLLFSNYDCLSYAWSGVDEGSARWHNDFKEGFNSNILVYLDDSYGQNKIEIKHQAEEFTIYHKKGDFVWINQAPGFLHKATHVTGSRRVLSFELWT